MHNRVISIAQRVRSSFWFLPSTMGLLALVGTPLLLRIDERLEVSWIVKTLPGPLLTVEGARLMLSTTASSMLTVSSLVLSMTLVALTLLSQQLGPRILQTFLEDTRTKFSFGYFLSVFIFSMLTLGATGSGPKGEFLPLLTTYISVVLALLAFAIMIQFVQHIASSIQADIVAIRLGNELTHAIQKSFEHGCENTHWLGEDEVPKPSLLPDPSKVYIALDDSGYIETIDTRRILHVACAYDVELFVLCRPGHHILKGVPVVAAARPPSNYEEFETAARAVFEIGERRTRLQHIEFEVHALVEVALRALSPGINDPFTALTCIDKLTVALGLLLDHASAVQVMNDEHNRRRVTFYPTSFSRYLDAAFRPIRQTSASNTVVMLKLLEALRQLCLRARTESHIEILVDHSKMIHRSGSHSAQLESDRNGLASRMQAVKDLAEYRRNQLVHPTQGPSPTRATPS